MVCTSTCYFISIRTFHQSCNISPVLELFTSLGTFHQSCNIFPVLSPVWNISPVLKHFTCLEHFTSPGIFHQFGTFFHIILILGYSSIPWMQNSKEYLFLKNSSFEYDFVLFHHNYWILIYTLTNWIIKLLYISFKLLSFKDKTWRKVNCSVYV